MPMSDEKTGKDDANEDRRDERGRLPQELPHRLIVAYFGHNRARGPQGVGGDRGKGSFVYIGLLSNPFVYRKIKNTIHKTEKP
jgi:hypothetical protein